MAKKSQSRVKHCSRCDTDKPLAEFIGKRPGAAEFEREFKTCARFRDYAREIQRARGRELAWLRAEALVPYETALKRKRAR